MSQVLEMPCAGEEASGTRDAKGRFTAGNKGGPGNPFGRRLAAMREAVMRAVGVEDIERLLRVLLAQALGGDLGAAKLVLQYAVGKPKNVAEPDRVEVEAWEVTGESWVDAKACSEMLGKVPVGLANVMVDAVSDVKVREMGAVLTDPAAAAKFFQQNVDEDDAPLTEEDIAEARREWVEANERVASQMRAEADRPSFAGTNGGDRPSFTVVNGADRPSPAATNGDRRPSFAAANGERSPQR